MSVGRICSRHVDLAVSDESIQAVARRMHDRKVGSLVVINALQEPVGIVTDRDLAVRVLAEARDPVQTTVADVMTKFSRTLREDAAIEDALALMRVHACRRIPIVGKDDKLVGLLSLDDILDLLAAEFGQIGGLLRRESPANLAGN